MDRELAQKYDNLKKQIERCIPDGVVVAFSGGVDSALLLKLVCMAAEGRGVVYAVTAETKLHPNGDLEAAKQTARECGALHKVLRIDELAETGVEKNYPDRCYRCKKRIFLRIKELAAELGAGFVLEGTNADDLMQYRPGIRALREMEIISPLAACGLTKPEIRSLAKFLDIETADRPSAPCLATRLPYGMELSYELLAKIDEGERYLRELGFYNVRLRVHELTEIAGTKNWEERKSCLARVEVDMEDMPKLLQYRRELVKKLKELGFHRITVDLEGFRSGSMDL